jgi:WD40 repeat protein
MRRGPKYPDGVKVRNTLEVTHVYRDGSRGVTVKGLAWSSAGDRLATIDSSHHLQIWSPHDGELVRKIESASGYNLAWSPDDQFIATEDGSVFDVASGRRVSESFQRHDARVRCVAWSPDGKSLATGAEDQFVGVWNCGTGKLKASLEGHTKEVTCLTWHPERNLLASASGGDKTVILWDTDSGVAIWSCLIPNGRVWNLNWLPHGKHLLVGYGNSLCLIDIGSGKATGPIRWDHEPRSASLSSDGVLFAATEYYHQHPAWLGLWFCRDWRHIITTQDVERSSAWPCVKFHPKQSTLAFLMTDELIRILDLDAEKLKLVPPQQSATLPPTDADTPLLLEDDKPGRNPVTEPDSFDVFCCYNSADRTEVQKIAQELKQRGFLPWLDQWQLRPGLPWQDALQTQVRGARSVAVFIGKRGFGPWQSLEMKAFIEEFTKRGCPVIPVLLPDFDDAMPLPWYLAGMTWVDFRSPEPDPLERLTFGITGSPFGRH